jgi:DNA modification methylase
MVPFLQDPDVTLYQGDALSVLRELDDESVDCCVTSPPYFQQRDYGADGQIGLEGTPAEYVTALVGVFAEVRRVLVSTGCLWLNIGDSYAASGVPEGLKAKDLIGIPWRLAFALQEDGWWLRSENIWWKPNALPESAEDRPHRAHEHVFQLSRSSHYHYDAEAVKEPAAWERWGAQTPRKTNDSKARGAQFVKERSRQELMEMAGKRNLRSVWPINTKPYADAHFAVMPEAVVRPCIVSSCPPAGVVLDPFAGTGTTGVVALSEGRTAVLIELNPESCALAASRLAQMGLFAEVSVEVVEVKS